jgi:hypothetical protein
MHKKPFLFTAGQKNPAEVPKTAAGNIDFKKVLSLTP